MCLSVIEGSPRWTGGGPRAVTAAIAVRARRGKGRGALSAAKAALSDTTHKEDMTSMVVAEPRGAARLSDAVAVRTHALRTGAFQGAAQTDAHMLLM